MEDALLSLPKQDIAKLLAAGSGDAALLYLYLRSGKDPLDAARALNMTSRQHEQAMATLRLMGLLAEERRRILDPGEHPVYTERDIFEEMNRSRDFGSFVDDVQNRLGRKLSTEELKILLSLRDYLGLPNDVITVLINFCWDRSRSRGNQRAPSMRTIEKEAYIWADNGIDNMVSAIAYVQQKQSVQSQFGQIRRALQIFDRRLTQSEERYITKWLEMGFSEPEISLAYERTVLSCGSLKWPYMNSILESWQRQNLYTVEQIEQYDRAPERTAPGYRPKPQNQPQTQTAVNPMTKRAIERLMNRKEET